MDRLDGGRMKPQRSHAEPARPYIAVPPGAAPEGLPGRRDTFVRFARKALGPVVMIVASLGAAGAVILLAQAQG